MKKLAAGVDGLEPTLELLSIPAITLMSPLLCWTIMSVVPSHQESMLACTCPEWRGMQRDKLKAKELCPQVHEKAARVSVTNSDVGVKNNVLLVPNSYGLANPDTTSEILLFSSRVRNNVVIALVDNRALGATLL